MNTGQYPVPDASGTIALPAAPAPAPAHPTLERALSNPIIKLVVATLFGVLLSYSTVQTTAIANKLEQNDTRLGSLEQYKAAHEATHAAVDKYRAEQSARWETELGAKEKRDQKMLEAYERDAALNRLVLEALTKAVSKGTP